MCLKLHSEDKKFVAYPQDSEFLKKLKNSSRQEITCWKVYIKRETCLSPIYYRKKVWAKGIVESNREWGTKLISEEKRKGNVALGIHVYYCRKDLDGLCLNRNEVIVPVICKLSDLVAIEYNSSDPWRSPVEAVFTKVRITKRTWKKIFGE